MEQRQLKKAKQLLDRLRRGTISSAEEALLLRWLNEYKKQPTKADLDDEALCQVTIELKERLDEYIGSKRGRQGFIRSIRIRNWVAAALIVSLTVVAGFYLWSTRTASIKDGNIVFDHPAGQDRAILVLEDGRKILLGDTSEAWIHASDYQIKQTSDSGLVYQNGEHIQWVSSENNLRNGLGEIAEASIPINTLQTPRGGQYRLVLPDGTQVWLNSESQITYPVRFADSREVRVIGEAYFQVKHDADRPFIVYTDRQRIDVLGTEFNVRAYPEQEITETVLVSGSLRASSANNPQLSVMLEPGQYAHLRDPESIGSGTANVTKAIAWRHGDFYFEDETLSEIMKVLSRWYDVDVDYRADLSDKGSFGGVISRDKNLSTVLQMLEATGKVKFKITEKEVVLMD